MGGAKEGGRAKKEGGGGGKEKREMSRGLQHARQDPLAPDTPASLAQQRRAATLGHSPAAGCQQSWEQEGCCTKKHISLFRAGHLATLMKSALVPGSPLSAPLYFCPRARFGYYRQDFQSLTLLCCGYK